MDVLHDGQLSQRLARRGTAVQVGLGVGQRALDFQQIGHLALDASVAQHRSQTVAELRAVLDLGLDVDHFGRLVFTCGAMRNDLRHAGRATQQFVHVGWEHAHLQFGAARGFRCFALQRRRQQLAVQRAAQIAHLGPRIVQLLRRDLDGEFLRWIMKYL